MMTESIKWYTLKKEDAIKGKQKLNNIQGADNLREIKPNTPTGMPTEKSCPSCGNSLVWTTVPCPNNKPGCAVAHYGYQCVQCRRCFAP